jgi:hypothetical protein
VRADVGGATLRRITDAMTGLTTRQLGDGSTVYRGTDPAAPLDTAVSVGADGIFRELVVTWGAGATAWTYRLAHRDLGETTDLVAPADARPLRRPR